MLFGFIISLYFILSYLFLKKDVFDMIFGVFVLLYRSHFTNRAHSYKLFFNIYLFLREKPFCGLPSLKIRNLLQLLRLFFAFIPLILWHKIPPRGDSGIGVFPQMGSHGALGSRFGRLDLEGDGPVRDGAVLDKHRAYSG